MIWVYYIIVFMIKIVKHIVDLMELHQKIMQKRILRLSVGRKCDMWIRVTTEKKAVHLLQPLSYSYIEGDAVEEYYFDDETAIALEEDGFLIDMWKKMMH